MEECIASLTPIASKSAVDNLDKDMATAAAAELNVDHACNGLMIASTFISTDRFVPDFLARKRQEVCDELNYSQISPMPSLARVNR
jgi:hypothetical protein